MNFGSKLVIDLASMCTKRETEKVIPVLIFKLLQYIRSNREKKDITVSIRQYLRSSSFEMAQLNRFHLSSYLTHHLQTQLQ